MKKLFSLAILLLVIPVFVSLAACGNVSTQDIQGLLQAMEGKEMVVTLSDGSTVRITVEDTNARNQAAGLVGERVNVRVRVSGNDRTLDVMNRQAAEDQKFTGAIETMGKDTWAIGGRTFKVDAATMLDGGLRPGVTARVEFITLYDGSMLATEIETDEEDEHVKGKIESISQTQVVVGGKTFQITTGTRLDGGLATGVEVKIEFAAKPDGGLVAVAVETDREDERFIGLIESNSTGTWKIGGRDFIVNNATKLDTGLITGVTARVEFIKLSDGKLVATEIETDQGKSRLSGKIDSLTADKVVINGQEFKLSNMTRLENVKVGETVEVRFVTSVDGTKQATRVRVETSGVSGRSDSGKSGKETEMESKSGTNELNKTPSSGGTESKGETESKSESGSSSSGGSGY